MRVFTLLTHIGLSKQSYDLLVALWLPYTILSPFLLIKYINQMKEQLVSHEVAKLAKEKGFKEFCNKYYDLDSRYKNKPVLFDGNIISDGYYHDDYFIAPTQALLQKWLREKTDDWMHIQIGTQSNVFWRYKIFKLANPNSTIDISTHLLFNSKAVYNTYEKALDEALINALNLI